MRLVAISHKETWASSDSPSGYATTGGFPFQMQAIADLFEEMTVLVPVRKTVPPAGIRPLTGRGLKVVPLPEPTGSDLRRKIALLTWFPQQMPKIWKEICRADAVHAAVPGDIGTIGLVLSLIQRKPLFVRHCGTWGNRTTLADRFLDWLLPRIAGGKNVVLATGGGDRSPSAENPTVKWIFSTSLTENEVKDISPAVPWKKGEALHLVTVGRVSRGKNMEAVIRALPAIQKVIPRTILDILGEGPARMELTKLADDLGVSAAVRFHGNVTHDEVLQVLSGSNVFVFPTKVKEGFPKAVLEALAAGLPVVASKVSVIPYLIRDAGAVLPDTTPEAVAETILDLIKDENQLVLMGQNARQVASKYTLKNWRETIRESLEESWGPLQP